MHIISHILAAGVSFGRHAAGVVTRPYETYRRIASGATGGELLYLGGILGVYFSLASIVTSTAFRPFLLTKQFVLLGSSAAATYLVAVFSLFFAARLFGGKGRIRSLALSWAYTLLPTVVWFLATSLLSVILPPPRTQSIAGIAFSLVFLVFSATLFWWKLTLAYLALRFSMKLDLAHIALTVAVSSPVIAGWSYLLYRWGIFKVPFI